MNVKELEKKIKKYAFSYYEGNPEISDIEFDKLTDELKEKDPDNPLFSTVGWGYSVTAPLNQTDTHTYEVCKFEDKIKKASEIKMKPSEGVISVKIDGGSIICYYAKGKLIKALTRGDGNIGYSVIEKMRQIVPATLKDKTFTGLVRGEIAMKNSVFNRKYADKYSSARNLAIGMIKRDTLTMTEIRDLSFVAYTVRGNSSNKLNSKTKVFEWLSENKFEVVDVFQTDNWSDENLRELIKNYDKYPIDGIVITSHRYRENSDNTFTPIREVAYKTDADSAEVTVTDITWNLTRTGRLFPTVWFTPVKLSGAVVQKATAFNYKYVKDEGLGKGSLIRIQRSGEVIPDVMEVLTKKEYKFPDVCPKCGNPLSVDGVHLVCKDPECKGQAYNTLEHWILTLTELKGLGSTIIENFTNDLDIETIDSFYQKLELIPNLYGRNSATRKLILKMTELLQEPVKFSTFLIACNIPMLGKVAAEEVAKKYKKLILEEPINDNWYTRMMKITGCNITARKNLIDKIKTIRRYAIHYVNIKEEEITGIEEKGTVAITGALSIPRTEFAKELVTHGWKLATSITGKVKYLITDNPDSGSSKNEKAKKLGVIVISEKDFRKIM